MRYGWQSYATDLVNVTIPPQNRIQQKPAGLGTTGGLLPRKYVVELSKECVRHADGMERMTCK